MEAATTEVPTAPTAAAIKISGDTVVTTASSTAGEKVIRLCPTEGATT